MQKDKRDLIFISHATPEDNTFTLWLATRLKLIGYQVWSDVTKLYGGEKWWDDIEQAINEFTCKFILVITKTSLSKPGVIRELELALSAEKKHQLKNFIVPIIIDDSEFGGQPYGLSERNIIAFSKGWGSALGKLKTRLSKDNVPTGEAGRDLGQKLMELFQPNYNLQKKDDLAVSNWLSLQKLPDHLNFFRIPGDLKSWNRHFADIPYPWFEWGGMLVSFSEKEVFQQLLPKYIGVSTAPRLDLIAVLDKRPRNHPDFIRGEVIKKINYLICEAWGRKMRILGLHQYEMASGKVGWFFPYCDEYSGYQKFADIFGETKKKQVIGYSPKNKVFWHYAVEIKAQYGPNAKACLIPHVVFTEDGKKPLSDKAKMHRLRRGFCANWWNDRWRDLLLAYLNLISKWENCIDIAVGENQSLEFSSRPILLTSEYSLTAPVIEDMDLADEVLDVEVDAEVDEQ